MEPILKIQGRTVDLLTAQQIDLLNKLYDFLVKYPWSFIAIFVVWALVILFFQRILHVHISPWIALLTLIVSVGIVIGIILILIQNNYVTSSLVLMCAH